ncbi:MAG TPA: bifunctional UDP-sugar hydrolase/5'-nucleotidase [Salinivirgaceae bacterium]|nr:bifunctional UDP-sugar hydrolase/5'-nucleotidase [Salinivirgaceae bacterium]HQA76340.1 bifunctional UDP-sugar hydrolase/5'-nucleotidase [Salinivirgaceae bacterium]
MNKFLPVLLLFLTITCYGASKSVAQKAIIEREVIILAVNDIHATIDNFPRFAFMVDSLRAIYPDMLLVSAGDYQTGNPINDQYHEKGRPIIELMNHVEFDLSAVGNHEFDVGVKKFETYTKIVHFDHLCANLSSPEGMEFNIKPYKIITLPNGLKVGFVSVLALASNNLPDCHPDNLVGFSFTNPFETAQKYLYLKDSTDLLIYINHFGFENDVKLANLFPKGAVDLIIGGHSHTKVEKEQIHNGIMITQAGRKLNYATLIHLTVCPDGQVSRSMQLLTVGQTGNEQVAVRAMVDKYNNDPEMQEVIAKANFDFRTTDELGYWMADALKATAKTEIAVVNKGGVRIDHLPAGEITRKTIFTIDPFSNQVVTVNLTGHELKAFIGSMFGRYEYSLMYPSGIHLNYTVAEGGFKLIDLELLNEDGTRLEMDKIYSVATNSYVIATADFKRKDPGKTLSITTSEGWINWLLEEKTVKNYQEVKRVFINE